MIVDQALVRKALNLPYFDIEAARERMIPRPRGLRPPDMDGQPRQGGVLIILYPKDGQTHLVLTRRRADLNAHAGQISFPGGRRESGETLRMAALREAEEEVGVKRADLTVLGHLSCLYIPPTDYEVYPYVAWHGGLPRFRPQASEVAEILEVPLVMLRDPVNHHEELWQIRGFEVMVPYFLVGEHKVWGATAIMLSEFLERLREAELL